ncbi:MAG TPA: hypothetical protein VFC41_04745 [Anaerovoracaceae bacterium]|nr:hypothetical protein [Anaerovoracaceae bacterium]
MEPAVVEISKLEVGVIEIFPERPVPFTVNDCSDEGPEPKEYENPVKLVTDVTTCCPKPLLLTPINKINNTLIIYNFFNFRSLKTENTLFIIYF